MTLKEILEKNKGIACLLPFYMEERGDCTKVVLGKGEEIILQQSIDTSLKKLCHYYTLDLKVLKKKQQRLLHCRYYISLPITPTLLLIPLKTRMPKVEKDTTTGYINYYDIETIDQTKPIIYLKNGFSIHCLNGLPTINKRYHQAQIISKLGEPANPFLVEPFYLKETSPYYHHPATKGDLHRLSQELIDIRRLLKEMKEA